MLNAYENIASILPVCPGLAEGGDVGGLFAFYHAVQVLREINPRYPAVSLPRPGITEKTRSHARRIESLNIKVGKVQWNHTVDKQIKISLSTEGMKKLITSNNYSPLSMEMEQSTEQDKVDFVKMCIEMKYPILVPYRHGFYTSWFMIVGDPFGLISHLRLPQDRNLYLAIVYPESPREYLISRRNNIFYANSAVERRINADYFEHATFGKVGWPKFKMEHRYLKNSLIAVVPPPIAEEPENRLWAWIPKSMRCC